MSKTIELEYAPYSYQEDFHASKKRFNIITGGRRVGKSRLALMEVLKHCLETKNAMAWWVAPTITMAREIGWNEFQDLKDELDPAIATVHETLLRVRFVNGSYLYFKGADNERSLRGRGLTYLVMDEAAFIDPKIWTQVLFPALTDQQGKALLVSTPNGRNWFYDQWQAAKQRTSWGKFHWPTHMNPLITQEELDQSMSMISEADFQQEFLAEFVTREGMVYDDFSDDNTLQQYTPDPIRDTIYLGVDFGYANPSAICFMAVNEQNEVIQFDEIYGTRYTIEELEQAIIETLYNNGLEPQDVKAIYTDPAGNAEEMSSGVSPVDYLRMSENRWTVKNKGTEIAPGLALVRSFIKTANGDRAYFVTNNCKNTIKSIEGYTYVKYSGNTETIKEEASKDGIHDHMCDAIRYFFVNAFDHNKWIADRPDQWTYGQNVDKKHIWFKRCPECKNKFPSKTPETQPPYMCQDCKSWSVSQASTARR